MPDDNTFFSELKTLIGKYEIDKISAIPSEIITEAVQQTIYTLTKANIEATKIYREAIEGLQKEIVDRLQCQSNELA